MSKHVFQTGRKQPSADSYHEERLTPVHSLTSFALFTTGVACAQQKSPECGKCRSARQMLLYCIILQCGADRSSFSQHNSAAERTRQPREKKLQLVSSDWGCQRNTKRSFRNAQMERDGNFLASRETCCRSKGGRKLPRTIVPEESGSSLAG